MKMIDDPIVAEVRKARDEYARRFNYDLDAICDDLQQKQTQSGRPLVSFPPKRPKQKTSLPSTTTKALQEPAPRQSGTLRGTVRYMAPDFDAPLDDFKDYME
jgi:hypothetical protein